MSQYFDHTLQGQKDGKAKSNESYTYILSKIGEGKAEEVANTNHATENFVIALLGMTDLEVESRKGDLATLIQNVNKDFSTRHVTFVLFDNQIIENKRIESVSVDEHLPPVTIIAIKPVERIEKPYLADVMNAAHNFDKSLGKRVDVALSDLSSAAWRAEILLLRCVAPYLRIGGKLIIFNQTLSNVVYSGGTYHQNIENWTQFYERGGLNSLEKYEGFVSPLPHYAKKFQIIKLY